MDRHSGRYGRPLGAHGDLPATPPTRRGPQASVYDLGHYEQMVIHLAILSATGLDVDFTSEHREALKGLRHIFESHGTVTVTRTNQED